MPQITVNSPNINAFSFSAAFDIANKQIILSDISSYNNISGHGVLFVEGIAFSIVDQDGTTIASIDWTNPQLPNPATTSVYNLELPSINFMFQTYTIVGAIKDSNGIIYTTSAVYKKICQPVGLTDFGYVYGIFRVTPNIPANTLAVSEATPFIYNNNRPTSITKSGNLYYPTGTINPVPFTGTPFTNNAVYSGEYRIVNTSIASYDLGDSVSVLISYYTNNNFNVFVGSKMSDLNCCIVALQETAKKRCSDAVGQSAKQKLLDISTYLMGGISAEINGQDSSFQYEYIKKYLNCDCGATSLKQNEISPINPAVTSIIVVGVNGTSVIPTINGNTTTYTVSSNIYQVVKGNTEDLAFTLSVDNTVSGVTKTIITFNYALMAGYLLTAIGSDDTLLAQLNALITFSNFTIDLSNLDGKCIIDVGNVDYLLQYKVPSGAALFKSITINGTLHTAPTGLVVSGTDSINAYLNGLGLGTFQTIFNNDSTGSYFSIVSAPNVNVLDSIVLTIGGADTSVNFQATTKSIVAVLQAIIDFLCGLTALQIALGNGVSLAYFDYNGNLVFNNLSASNTQNDFNQATATSIQNIINRINTLQALTCAKLQALFQDYPSAVFNQTSDRFLSIVGGNCTTLTARQAAFSFIAAVNANSDIKAAFCAIDCTLPGTCPDVSGINLSLISNGSNYNLALYGLSWSSTTMASQTVTVKYRVSGTTTFNVATNSLLILPNGNISGTSPYILPFTAALSTSYDVQIINNCGGTGFITQITTPATTVFISQHRYGNILYLVCGQALVTLYSASAFAVGVTMYTDIGLTTPLTGYNYITNFVNEVFTMHPSTGVVFADTGNNCANGTSNNYLLGNNSSTVCTTGGSYVLYTNGAFAVGGILYFDSSLTQPVNGSSFVVYLGQIYNLDSTTGIIGALTGVSCNTATTLTFGFSGGVFLCNMTNTVPFNLTIGSMSVRGFSGSSCGAQIESASLSSMVMAAGSSVIDTGVLGMSCASNFYIVTNGITLNGTAVVNGSIVTISGIIFTVVINNTTCSPYSC